MGNQPIVEVRVLPGSSLEITANDPLNIPSHTNFFFMQFRVFMDRSSLAEKVKIKFGQQHT